MTEIAVRLDSESVLTEERDIRVDDFLNDKLQIGADLENLDSLLLNAKNQQILLRKQVCCPEFTDWQPVLTYRSWSTLRLTSRKRNEPPKVMHRLFCSRPIASPENKQILSGKH